MNYHNLLVHLDDSQAARQHLEIALLVARQFDAQLVGPEHHADPRYSHNLRDTGRGRHASRSDAAG
ncbi:hypothetical protein [Paraburkholderia youngii]|uniref:hypothetical protein n=2 Tax=Burkholderiaceae TaxID=119060 RepID=UPI003D20399A